MLRPASLVLAGLLAMAATHSATAESSTTRIETRPFYGATVTLEEGVRVFRPLPPTKNMIINPEGRTPLNLTIEDVRVTEERNINHFHHQGLPRDQGRFIGDVPVVGATGGFIGPQQFRRNDGFRNHRRQGGRPAFGPAR